jgi:hypothetical protein
VGAGAMLALAVRACGSCKRGGGMWSKAGPGNGLQQGWAGQGDTWFAQAAQAMSQEPWHWQPHPPHASAAAPAVSPPSDLLLNCPLPPSPACSACSA